MTEPLTRQTVPVNYGGLMRCCAETIRQWAVADPTAAVKDGERLVCRYCESPMVVNEGVLEWARDD
jgi:hypothetical protein